MAKTRGNLDTIDQTQVRELSGGEYATQFMTTDDSAKVVGNILTVNARGNVVDSGIPLGTHAELLTDGKGNLLFANGDVITVVGVPN